MELTFKTGPKSIVLCELKAGGIEIHIDAISDHTFWLEIADPQDPEADYNLCAATSDEVLVKTIVAQSLLLAQLFVVEEQAERLTAAGHAPTLLPKVFELLLAAVHGPKSPG